MAEFFRFDDLTWPEVAALPRDLPLVLPLGTGYPEPVLEKALAFPTRIGWLPVFPFGWPGSGLELPAPTLVAYLKNLLDSLREDGFTRVYALTPPGIDLGLAGSQLHVNPDQAQDSPGLALHPQAELNKVILMPIGHTEQHSLHLPLSVDTMIIEAIANGAAQSAPDIGYALPVMPYGVSTHREAFAGTMNAGGRAFEDFWLAVIDALVARGFNRFYLLSGHGGNMSFLTNVVKYAGDRHPRLSGRQIFCATAFLYLSGPEGVAALEKYRHSTIGGMGHACELETSLILHLCPGLVCIDRVVDETGFITTPSYYMDWIEGGALIANPPWQDDSATGAYGAGSLATAEHGRLWLEAAIAEKVVHVDEIHEQFLRRSRS